MQLAAVDAEPTSPKASGGIRARLAKLGGGIPMLGMGGAPRAPPSMPRAAPAPPTGDGALKHDTLRRASGPRKRRTAKVVKFTATEAVVEAVDTEDVAAPARGGPPPMPPRTPRVIS